MASVLLVQDPNNQQTKTFYHDENLPSLPLPSLEQTIKKYLESCKAVLSEEEFKTTEAICSAFVEGEGKQLHEKLSERAKVKKNWLEEWWLNKVYLDGRWALPLGNFSGPGTYMEHYWPLEQGSLLNRSALGMYIFMQFWKLVRKEMITAHKTSDGKPLTMHQFRYLFNTCRIPQRGTDVLHHSFKTEAEGYSPTHIIVLFKGYIFKMPGTNPTTGEICTPGEFYFMYKHIYEECSSRPAGPGVAALTSLERDQWAEARSHLISIDLENEKILNDIETSLIVSSIDDCSPQNYSEISHTAMTAEDPSSRWYDKSYNSATTNNGASLCNCDHTPYDAMVMVAVVEFITFALKQFKGKPPAEKDVNDFIRPQELKFNLDATVVQSISEAKLFHQSLRDNLEVLQLVFDKFGKTALKQHNIHPDFMVQLCLQLAYMEMHGKPAPTYETAMTRQFYHGRTETCRTCTPEVVEFCNNMISNSLHGSSQHLNLHKLLISAQNKFLSLMGDCTANQGCDRHLLGLLYTCLENGYKLPEIYTDKAFEATGGNGKFILSTSCVGYFHAQGGVPPMTEDGYGFFYRINDNKIIFTLTAFNSCPDTSARKLADCFEYAMVSVLQVISDAKLNAKI